MPLFFPKYFEKSFAPEYLKEYYLDVSKERPEDHMWTKEKALLELEPHQDMLVSAFKDGIALTKALPLEYRGMYDTTTLAMATFRHIWTKIKETHDPASIQAESENGLHFLRTNGGLVLRVKKKSPHTGMPTGQPTRQACDYYSQEDLFGANANLVLCYEPDEAFENLLLVELIATSHVQPKGGRPVSDWNTTLYNANINSSQVNLMLPENDIPAVQKRITIKAKKKQDAG